MTDRKRFTLRVDSEIFDKVQEQADKNRRSVAKEIEYLLERHLEESDKSEEE